VAQNKALKVKLPKAVKTELQVWNVQELNKFLHEAKNDPMYTVFLLALSTGMRQGEILGLRWKDVCFNTRIISIKQTLRHDGKTILTGAKTQASLRKIEMSQKLIEQLKSHKKKMKG
jgi:integrase